MNAPALAGRIVLVVEDEYLIALQVESTVRAAGAEVVGPVGTLGDALAIVASAPQLDAAVLDINLRGEMVYPVADALVARNVPFVFATGYDDAVVPERFAHIPVCDKPPLLVDVLAALRLG